MKIDHSSSEAQQKLVQLEREIAENKKTIETIQKKNDVLSMKNQYLSMQLETAKLILKNHADILKHKQHVIHGLGATVRIFKHHTDKLDRKLQEKHTVDTEQATTTSSRTTVARPMENTPHTSAINQQARKRVRFESSSSAVATTAVASTSVPISTTATRIDNSAQSSLEYLGCSAVSGSSSRPVGTDGNQLGSFQCDICQEMFPSQFKLSNHKHKKHDDPKFECAVCGSRFHFQATLFVKAIIND